MKYRLVNVSILIIVALFVSVCQWKNTGPENSDPNIFLIMSDDHAYQAISSYNSSLINTPNIDRLADEGVVFQRAFVTNSICAPSRAVILTGKYSHLNGVKGNSEFFDGNQETMPKLFQQHGYETAIVGKWHLKSDPVGFDYWNVLPGQGDYYNPDFKRMGADTVYQGYVTDIITDLTIEFLDHRDHKKPFFMMMHHKAPHRNWMPALKYLHHFSDSSFRLPKTFHDQYENRLALQRQMLTVANHMDIRLDFKIPCDTCDTVAVNHWAPSEFQRRMARLTNKEKRIWDKAYQFEVEKYISNSMNEDELIQWMYNRYLQDYLRCILSVDESVGVVLDYLNENDLENNTLVVYTSDQGFFLGEHGLFDKRFMYEEAFRTPMLMRFPNQIEKGLKLNEMVLNLDIAPTLLTVAGIEVPRTLQGKSMTGLWTAGEVQLWREAIYYHYYEMGFGATPHYGIRTDRYKLIHYYDPIDSWELFDLESDPYEITNIYGQKENIEIISSLKNQLTELQKQYLDVEFK